MLSVLVISPNPSVPGGVSVFIECMKRHIEGCRIVSFYIGSNGKDEEATFSILRRLLVTPLQLARLVKRDKFDVVHINPSFDGKSLIRDGLLLLALRASGFRQTMLYFHGWDVSMQRRILRFAPLRAVTAWLLNKASLITVLGGDFRDGLVAMGVDPELIVVTRTMFEGEELAAVEAELPALGNKASRRYILFMSRFDAEKGGRELLEGFAAVARDYPDLDLVMAGDGADGEYLKAQAQRLELETRIKFPGYINGPDKWRLLRDCSLFALPSYYRSEGMPVAVLEAMGAGKPVLVGSAGALRSMVTDPANGVMLEKVTPQKIANGLRRLFNDKGFGTWAGTNNRKLAWEKYEAHAVTAEIETYYRKVAKC